MPRKIRLLSGKDMVKILESYGFVLKRNVGSHARLTLEKDQRSFHVTIPLHSEMKKGTLRSVINELEKCVDSEILEKDFYTEK
ncbi:MAG: hypothetical protein RL292_510 [Candidatus Parcubacteria bacterium]|jgi:predicted RNA binding protein YcfA (HicA-like mRNA interferase family)